MEEKMVLNVEEVGRILGISRCNAYQLANSYNGFPTIRLGKRILIPREQLMRWLDEKCKESSGNA